MSNQPLHRIVALAFAAVVTLAMLGGIEWLAQPDEAAPQWAQQLLAPRA